MSQCAPRGPGNKSLGPENPAPQNPDYEARTRDSFARQKAMAFIGARLGVVRPGEVEIALAYREELTQQHGFIHGGIVGMLADNACGYAAFSLLPAESSIVTVEYKLNLLAPAEGEALVARGRVLRAGRSLIVAEAAVFARRAGEERQVAAALGTLMPLHGRADGKRDGAARAARGAA
jgi:uncharacterized protein (TIGR00369 family)